jgi:hypothetical protein
MPKKLVWTDAQDTTIKRLRSEGATWDTIATLLRLTRWTVIDRGRHIGARPPPTDFIPLPDDPDREPLRAGHPRTWDVLVRGTCLEGVPYPAARGEI